MSRSTPAPLAPLALRRRVDPAGLGFTTTAELTPLPGPVGQARAIEALRFGARMHGQGYHVFASGPAGSGRRALILEELKREAAQRPAPDDWLYVFNFEAAHRPRAMRLPAGQGARLRDAMARLVDDLKTALPAAFGREENRRRQEAIEAEFQARQQAAMSALGERAAGRGVLLVGTASGFGFAPMDAQGEALHPAAFAKLPPEEQARVKEAIEALQAELQETVRQFPLWFREMRERIKALNREIAEFVVGHLADEVATQFTAFQEVLAHLRAVRTDILEHVGAFMPAGPAPADPEPHAEVLQRYAVNLLVDNAQGAQAPVVELDLPTLGNLLGRIEHRALLGAFVTDFTLVKAGALHRANGGFLLIDARRVLLQPFAWEALKRGLRAREIRLDGSEIQFSPLTTLMLEPQAIPLEVKVVLVGERWLLYLLDAGDPEFRDLFHVVADFEDDVARSADAEREYTRLFARLAADAGTRALDAGAAALLLEHCARLAEDAERLTTQVHAISDVIREADFLAAEAGAQVLGRVQVAGAIAAQRRRSDRLRERVLEDILRGTRLISTDGLAIGQVNGLSVVRSNSFSFGQPSRITATTRLGEGTVVDIERETELGGALHSKGVLILGSFLAARYAQGIPLSLEASLVFEQSYGPVDGDSASLAELCALLSSLAGTPIRQGLAVTGSVNQLGEVQAIGGVNEKVEGFFDLCARRGLAPGQGVIIPAANVKHLMLREDVVAAGAAGLFAVWPVGSVDEALHLLTGVDAGEQLADGSFPLASVNGRVTARLRGFSALRREFAQPSRAEPADRSVK